VKVLVYNPLTAVWRPRLPAVLSIVQELIDAGHEVVYIGCNRSVPACTANLDHTRAICTYCMARKRKGLELLSGRFREQDLLDYLSPERAEEIRNETDNIEDVAALRALKFSNADVGYAAYSSYAYVSKKSEPNLANATVRKVIQNLVNTGKTVYEAIGGAIVKERPDQVIVYHGRSAIDRAALRACQHAGVECLVYESALSLNQLVCFKNALPQDIENTVRMANELWDNAPEDKYTIGRSFFEMRRGGTSRALAGSSQIATQDRSFIGHQVAGRIPNDWDRQRKNVVIYGTSNDEFDAISAEYDAGIYRDQIDALDQISKSLENDPSIHLYFRLHPRQAGVRNEYTMELEKLGAERANVTVIGAGSEVSSYSLLDVADLALAFRSTMSIEAVYWGKPCVVLSASIYKPLGATYNPASHAEVLEMIRADLPPKDNTPALKMAYYLMKRGFSNPYFTSDIDQGREGYSFRGQPILVKGLSRWRYIASREWQKVKWRRMV
jgi:hypothetical protein